MLCLNSFRRNVEFWYALCYCIFICTIVDGINGLCFNLLRNIKIRLTYAKVHRILHFLCQIKDFSYSRGVYFRHPLGNHYFLAFSLLAGAAAVTVSFFCAEAAPGAASVAAAASAL